MNQLHIDLDKKQQLIKLKAVNSTKLEYKKLDKPRSIITLDFETIEFFNDKNLEQIYPIIKNKLIDSINHLIDVRKLSNFKMLLGCSLFYD